MFIKSPPICLNNGCSQRRGGGAIMEKFLNNFWNEPVPKKNAFLKGHCPENIYLPSLLNVSGGQLGPG